MSGIFNANGHRNARCIQLLMTHNTETAPSSPAAALGFNSLSDSLSPVNPRKQNPIASRYGVQVGIVTGTDCQLPPGPFANLRLVNLHALRTSTPPGPAN